jgi:RHS repeat-associated protein
MLYTSAKTVGNSIMPNGRLFVYTPASVGLVYTDSKGGRYVFSGPDANGAYSMSGLRYLSGAKAYRNLIGYPSGYMKLVFSSGAYNVFDAQGNLVEQVDSRGNKLTVARTASGAIVGISDSFGRSLDVTTTSRTVEGYAHRLMDSVTDAAGNMVEYSYDTLGLLNAVTWSDASGASNTVAYTYNAVGILNSIVDARGIVRTINTYDAKLRVTEQSHEDGGTFHFDYTESGGLVTETMVTAPYLFINTTYAFDGKGYTTSITEADPDNPTGYTTSYGLGAKGVVESVTGPIGPEATYTYTAAGLINSVTDASGNETRFFYTPGTDKPTQITDASGATVTLGYGPSGELTSILRPGALEPITLTYAPATGLPTSITDEDGSTVYYEYDSHGMLKALSHSVTGVLARYEYDAIGRVTRVEDAEGQAATYAYSNIGRTITMTGPEGDVTVVEYDANGNLTKVTDDRGNSVSYAYNSRDNLSGSTDQVNNSSSRSYTDGTNVYADRPYEITDRLGHVTRMTYGNVDRYFRADYLADGGYDEYVLDAGLRLVNATSSTEGTVSYTYTTATDPVAGRVETMTAPEGTVSYIYNTSGRRTGMDVDSGMSVAYGYDAQGRMDTLTAYIGGTSYPFGFTFDSSGRRQALTFPNGVVATYAYDTADQLTGISIAKDSATLESFSYTYDRLGRRASMTREGVDLPIGDAMSAVYNAANRMTSYNVDTPTHDAEGNMTGMGGETYTWNQKNQLIGIANSSGTYATFTYDALGRRIEKTINGVTKRYLYDGADIVAEKDGAGTVIAWYIHGMGIDEPLARVDASTGDAVFYHADGLGSIAALTEADGAVVTRYAYGPYGETAVTGTDIAQPFRYTAREWDGATGLYFYRARYYSPEIGRFISEDPIGLAGGINFYAYVGNDPVNYTDPSGLRPPEAIPDKYNNLCMILNSIDSASNMNTFEFASAFREGGDWDIFFQEGGSRMYGNFGLN